ncbi:hypothetical protein JZ751_006030, partial [Albula glossodonta]
MKFIFLKLFRHCHITCLYSQGWTTWASLTGNPHVPLWLVAPVRMSDVTDGNSNSGLPTENGRGLHSFTPQRIFFFSGDASHCHPPDMFKQNTVHLHLKAGTRFFLRTPGSHEHGLH